MHICSSNHDEQRVLARLDELACVLADLPPGSPLRIGDFLVALAFIESAEPLDDGMQRAIDGVRTALLRGIADGVRPDAS